MSASQAQAEARPSIGAATATSRPDAAAAEGRSASDPTAAPPAVAAAAGAAAPVTEQQPASSLHPPLTGRVSVPLPIPVGPDLLRPPRAANGVDALGVLVRQAIGHQKKQVSGAIQAVVSRESSLTACETSLAHLSHAMSETDHLMAEMVDGMGRLELVMAAAARPVAAAAATAAAAGGRTTRSGWVALKPEYAMVMQEQARRKHANIFARGMMKAYTAAARASASPPPPTSTTTPQRPPAHPAHDDTKIAADRRRAAAHSPDETSTRRAASSPSSVVHVNGIPVPIDQETKSILFRPVGSQPPLCRLYQKQGCPLSASECPHLHVVEADCKPCRVYCVDEVHDTVALAEAMHGIPYILFHLAAGEEAQYSLWRRTLDQHAPFMRRTHNLRHALLHWAVSPPADRLRPLMRPNCRILHFAHFTQLTHKHRFQSCIRKHIARLRQQIDDEDARGDQDASADRHRRLHVFDFYPTTLMLPMDRSELLSLHRSLGGEVDEAIQHEAVHPSQRAQKAIRKEKRSGMVGDIVVGAEDGIVADVSSSPDGVNSSPTAPTAFWQQFKLPHFMEKFPYHYSRSSGVPPSDSSAAASPLAAAALRRDPPIWILKPYSRGGGHGIIVTDFARHVKAEWITGEFVAATYIQRPLLIDKAQIRQAHEERTRKADPAQARTTPTADLRKFDLRLYVLLRSPYFPCEPSAPLDGSSLPAFPFQVFLYTDGLARFASHTYDHAAATESDRLGTRMDAYTHLTNNAINVTNDARLEQAKGCWENCNLHTLKTYFDQQRVKLDHDADTAAPSSAASSPYAWQWEYVWSQVRHLVLHSLCVSDDYLQSGLDRANRWSFELFGLDVLIDDEFRVHLCEINSMPDLNSSTPLMQYHRTFPVDHDVKSRMLADVLNAIRLRADEEGQASASADEGRTTTTSQATMTNIGGFERLV